MSTANSGAFTYTTNDYGVAIFSYNGSEQINVNDKHIAGKGNDENNEGYTIVPLNKGDTLNSSADTSTVYPAFYKFGKYSRIYHIIKY